MIATAASPTTDRSEPPTSATGSSSSAGCSTPAEMADAAGRGRPAAASMHTHLMDTKNLRCRWQDNVVHRRVPFETFDPVIDLVARSARRLALRPAAAGRCCATLYGEPACLFKDKLIFKPPGVKGYGLHQDWIAWPGFPRSFLTVLVPFDPADRDNGCTVVYPGYHHAGPLSPEDGEYHELPAEHGGRGAGGAAGAGAGRRGGLRRVHAAPLRPEPVRPAGGGSCTSATTADSDGGDQRDEALPRVPRLAAKKYAEYGKTDDLLRVTPDRRPMAIAMTAPRPLPPVAERVRPAAGRSRSTAPCSASEPAKLRADYAKFEPDDPPLVLSLEPTPRPAGGALNHLGFRLPDAKAAGRDAGAAGAGRHPVASARRASSAATPGRRSSGSHDPDGNAVGGLHARRRHRPPRRRAVAGGGARRDGTAGAPSRSSGSTAWASRCPTGSRSPTASADEVRLRGTLQPAADGRASGSG